MIFLDDSVTWLLQISCHVFAICMKLQHTL